MKKLMTCAFFLSAALLVTLDLEGSDAAGILGIISVVTCLPALSMIVNAVTTLVLPKGAQQARHQPRTRTATGKLVHH